MSYTPPPELRGRVLSATRGRPSATRGESEQKRRLWLLLAAAPLVVMALRSRPWAAEWPATKAAALGATALVGAAGAWWLGRGGPAAQGRPGGFFWAAALGAPLVFAGALLGASGPAVGAWFLQIDAVCFALGLGLAAPPLAAGLALARGGDPVHPAALGAWFGAVAGSWAGVAMAILCPHSDLSHLLLAHGGPLLLLPLLGAPLGARWLALRPASSAS